VEKSLWKEGIKKDASAKILGSRNKVKRRLCAKKGESVFTVERGEGGSASIREGPVEERIYPTLQIAPNITGTLCSKKGWKVKNGTRLSSYKLMDDKEWIPPSAYCGYTGWSRKEEGLHETGSEVGL